MGRLSERVLRRTQSSKGPDPERIDRWFARASHFSQVLLLALGVFGYFYTVLPVYQKSLLDEDIAQKSLELREKERQARALELQIAARTDELQKKNQLLASVEQKAQAAEYAQRQAMAAVQSATREARDQYRLFRAELVNSFTNQLRFCPMLTRAVVRGKVSVSGEHTFRVCIEEHLSKTSQALAELKDADRVKYADTVNRLLVEFQVMHHEKFLSLETEEAEAIAALAEAEARYEVARKEAGNDQKKRVSAYNDFYPAVSKAIDKRLKASEASSEFLDVTTQSFVKRLVAEVFV